MRQLKTILIFTIFTGYSSLLFAQKDDHSTGYDDTKQRLLLKTLSTYVYNLLQGQIDQDSAMVLSCKMYNLSHLLPFNEEHSQWESDCSSLVENGKVKEAESLLKTLTEKDKIHLLLDLGTFYLFKPGTNQEDLNQTEKFVTDAIQLSRSIHSVALENESLMLKGHLYFQSGRAKESVDVFQTVAASWEHEGNEYGLGKALLVKARHLDLSNPEKMQLLERSLAIFKKLDSKEKELEVMQEIAIMHFRTRPDLIENDFLKIIEFQQSIAFHHHQYFYDLLTYISSLRGEYSKSIFYSQKTIESLKTKGDSVILPVYLHRRGGIYAGTGNVPEASKWYRQAFEKKEKFMRPFWYASMIDLANLLCLHQQYEEALNLINEASSLAPPSAYDRIVMSFIKGYSFQEMENNVLADRYYHSFDSLVRNYPQNHIYGSTGGAYLSMARSFLDKKRMIQSKSALEQAKRFYNNLNVADKSVFHHVQYRLDTLRGSLPSAIKNFELYKQYYDSNFRMESKRVTEEFIVKYETEKKDKDIQLLRQEGELQQARLDQSHFARNITFAGAALLLFIAGLLYYLYYAKQKSNRQLTHLLDEKEWLLKEIHHRVKNNLQTVLSLLESQSRQLSKEASLALQESQNRVYAMSLIHKKLYQSTDVSSINMEDYLRDLVQHLRDSFGSSTNIRFSLELDGIELDVSQAVPVGLIVNEAITNSIKYAFPGRQQDNEVNISLKKIGDNKVVLHITDNGVGIDGLKDNSESLGLKLLRGLTEDIEGTFTIETNHGVTIMIEFIANMPFQKVAETRLLQPT